MLIASKDVSKRNRAERKLRDTLAENAHLREELELERDYLREEVNVAMNSGQIVGSSPALMKMLKRIADIVVDKSTVSIGR